MAKEVVVAGDEYTNLFGHTPFGNSIECICLHAHPSMSFNCVQYLFRATSRLVMVSGTWNAVKMQVLVMLFGFGVLTNWKFILNELPPLSPPIFTHTLSDGMLLSCHVSWLRLQNGTYKLIILSICKNVFICGVPLAVERSL